MNIAERYVQMETGETIRLIKAMDDDGNHVTDPDLVRRIVAGPCEDGRFYVFLAKGSPSYDADVGEMT